MESYREWLRPKFLALPILALVISGCGSGTPAPPPGPPAPPAKKLSELPLEEQPANSNQAQAAEKPKETPKAPAEQPEGFSGDTEPLGTEETFSIIEDAELAGAAFAVELPVEQANVDRFAYVQPPPQVDSGRFVALPSETGAIPPEIADDEALATKAAPTPPRTPNAKSAGVQLPPGFSPVPAAGVSLDGYPLRIRCDFDGSLMAFVPEGTSLQGKNGMAANAAPEHAVLLDAYYIDLREVTYEKYERYRELAREAKRRVAEPARRPRDPREPVTGLSWGEARAYATTSGRDLPTEAEWERSARGSEGFDFPWGNGAPVWHRPREIGQLDRVSSFRGDYSPYGVYDLAGNAREWCHDFYSDKYYQQLTDTTPSNPPGPKVSGGTSQRVVKGGHPQWFAWARAGLVQSERPADVGFRCVLRLKAADGRRAATGAGALR